MSVPLCPCFGRCGGCSAQHIDYAAHLENKRRRLAQPLGRLRLQGPLFVIADPPRSGMEPRALLALNELKPERILYISCNLKRLAIGIKRFPGREVRSAALFDLFPQTDHIEAVVEL